MKEELLTFAQTLVESPEHLHVSETSKMVTIIIKHDDRPTMTEMILGYLDSSNTVYTHCLKQGISSFPIIEIDG